MDQLCLASEKVCIVGPGSMAQCQGLPGWRAFGFLASLPQDRGCRMARAALEVS